MERGERRGMKRGERGRGDSCWIRESISKEKKIKKNACVLQRHSRFPENCERQISEAAKREVRKRKQKYKSNSVFSQTRKKNRIKQEILTFPNNVDVDD